MKKIVAIVALSVLAVSLLIGLVFTYNNLEHTRADLEGTIASEEAWSTPGYSADGKVVVQGTWLCYENLPAAESEPSLAGTVHEMYGISNQNLLKYDRYADLYTLLLSGALEPNVFVGKCSDGTQLTFFRCGNYWVTAPEAIEED